MTETALFGTGCFWCTEAIFSRLKGVVTVAPGYAGGTSKNPTYEDVRTGQTGHAEVLNIAFDPAVITYDSLLDVFFHVHDPTTLNRQGNDIGTQYRSIIFYASDEQKEQAEQIRTSIERSGIYANPIVTEIKPMTDFYPAESYHKRYFEENADKPYCQYVIVPKLAAFSKKYQTLLKNQT